MTRMNSKQVRLGLTNERGSQELGRYTKPRQPFHERDMYSASNTAEFDGFHSKGSIESKRLTLLTTTARKPASKRVYLKTTAMRKRRVSAARREQCRINQARYRDKQRKHTENLESDISQLQEKIKDLETQRQTILRCSPTSESVWVVATEYFRLFRHGYMTPMEMPKPSTSAPPVSSREDASDFRRQHQTHVQLDFLKSTMASDVTDGHENGVEALIKNWKLLSLYCDDVQMQLKCLEHAAADCLFASTTTNVTITEKTLQNLFPHLVVDEDNTEADEGTLKLSPLAERILNQRLVLGSSVRFDWDVSTGRVMRLESKVDLLTPMLRLLGSLEDVAAVFDGALVLIEGRLVTPENGTEDVASGSQMIF